MLADRNTLAKRIPPRMLPVLGDILGGFFIAIFKNSVLIQDAEVCGIVAEPVFFAWAECPLLSAERQKISSKFVQLSTNAK